MGFSIHVSEPAIDETEVAAITKCVRSGWLTQGKIVSEFEQRFAAFCMSAHGIATTSGTTALHLVLKALDIREGDEVIVPNLTFVATVNPVKYCGATPVLVDVDSATWNLDPLLVEKAITKRTRAIIVVHLYGLPAEMYAIKQIADKHGIYVIEDAAEAIGGIYHNKPVGSFSDAAVFSFYGNKTITTGEGGMVVTNNHDLANRLRYLRGQAQDVKGKYYHSEVGFNYRMTDMQATIGCAQMDKIASLITTRQEIWGEYANEFPHERRQHVPVDRLHAGWMFVLLFKNPLQRMAAERAFNENGIETRPVFVPLHRLPPYAKDSRDSEVVPEIVYAPYSTMPNSDSVYNRGLCLPTHSKMSFQDVQTVSKVGKDILEREYFFS